MLEITNLRHGAILNHCHGTENDGGLEIQLTGLSDTMTPVMVNGVEAERVGRSFSAPVKLVRTLNEITVSTRSGYGEFIQKITLVRDKKSFRRYNFFIDDNSFFWTDLIRETPKSIFDQFYLKFLKSMHDRYGTKFTLNCFYRNDHDPAKPEMSAVPDRWKGEFIANSDWLRLAFHGYSEFPDRPYQDASAEKLLADYDLVASEIIRFAGKETLIAPLVIHWAMCPPSGIRALHSRGVRTLFGAFLNADTGRAQQEAYAAGGAGADSFVNPLHTAAADPVPTCDIGFFANLDDASYLATGRRLYSTDFDICFGNSLACCNLATPQELKQQISRQLAASPDVEAYNLMTHEQYSYPGYQCYLPDHMERI